MHQIVSKLGVMKKILLACLIVGSVSSAFSQAPKYSNEFLAIGVGARALGMSNSVVALSNDVMSGYWNPAGLTSIQSDLQVGLMHSEYFAGIAKYEYGGLAFKIDNTSSIGFNYIRFGVDDIPDTSELLDANGNIDYDRIKSFSAIDNAFLFSYARKSAAIDGLSIGGNVKIIKRKVGSYAQAWGFGLDAAANYEIGNLKLGVVGRDITSTFNAWSFDVAELQEVFTLTGNEIPQNSVEVTLPRLSFGAGYLVELSDFTIYPELDFDVTFDGKRNVLLGGNFASLDPRFGLEAGYNDLVFLRAGLGNFQRVTDLLNVSSMTLQPNMGIGLKLKLIELDYALTDIGDQSTALYSHVFSLKIGINKQ